MTTKARFLVVFVLASAVLFSGVPMNSLNRAHALQFLVSAPGLDGKTGKRIIVISLNNDKAIAAVSQNSGALQVQPVISVSPLSVVLNTTQGVDVIDPPVTISNNGPAGSVLNWSATASELWIGLSPQASGTIAAGSPPMVVGVGAHVAGLNVGTHTGTITISDPTASNSPQTVAVTLNITAPTAYTWNVSCNYGDRESTNGRYLQTFTPSVNLTLTMTTENVGIYQNPGLTPNPVYGVLVDTTNGTILAMSTPETVPIGAYGNVSFPWPSMPQLSASKIYEYYYIPGGGVVMSGDFSYPDQCPATFTGHL